MGTRTRFQHPVIATALAILLGVYDGAPARASGQGESGTGSSNSSESSGSSKGSGDSSNSSNDSSKSSSGSSKDSDNSTQNSPKNSSDYTTHGSTDWTTHSHGAHVISIALAVVAIGATVAGVMLKDRSQQGPLPIAALSGFMRRQHALLLHDISTADGPVLAAWAHDLRLTPAETVRLRHTLEGSAEQGLLLDALDGTIDEKQAERFGVAFFRVTDRALGRTRTKALVARAMTAGRPG